MLQVVATSVDGRTAVRRIPVVVYRPKPKPAPNRSPRRSRVPLAIAGQTVADGQEVTGLVSGASTCAAARRTSSSSSTASSRGSDVAAPYTLGWNADAEPPGPHRLTARAVAANGKTVEATVTVTVPPRPAGSG